jgi:hypothetical protein
VKVKFFLKISLACFLLFVLFDFSSCKKNKYTTDPEARVHFSQDSVLFDTVFTKIGSATRNIRVVNNHNQKIKITSIDLAGGSASPFIVNVDGSPGRNFKDLEIAANDSMYIFIQVNVNPTNQNSPLIINDELRFMVNGHQQSVYLEAWGQDAYYHYPTDAIKFKDGSYLPYSLISPQKNASVTWVNDKPHVVYGWLVVDSGQALNIQPGVRVYFNYKAGLWVYQGGQLKVKGQLGNEVFFQGARREKDYADEPGQWDRIWINENLKGEINEIDHAIIKNAFIGIQLDPIGDTIGKGKLKLTNTRIQNMSKWGIYSLGHNIYGENNVVSNCQEYCLNILLGGSYTFLHCSFVNQWAKEKARDKPAISINNHLDANVLPLDSCYFGNCIIDGKLNNEVGLDLSTSNIYPPQQQFSNCYLKTNNDTSDPNVYINCRKKSEELDYEDAGAYYFKPKTSQGEAKNFVHPKASQDALRVPFDIELKSRNTASVTAGAYEIN